MSLERPGTKSGKIQSGVVRIQPSTGWSDLGLGELWTYRDLLRFHVYKNIKAKYRQMALGPIWIVLQPIITMVVFTIVFGKLAKLNSDGIPYPLLTYAGLLPWMLFQNSCGQASNSLVSQMNVISKVYFPRMIVPLAETLSSLVDFVLAFLILLVLMASYGIYPGWRIITIPAFVLFVLMSALSLGFWTASLTVRFRDVKLLVTYGLRVFMYLCPVAYSASAIPERWMWLYKLNPVYWFTEGFRWALLGGSHPPTLAILIPFAFVTVLFVTGAFMFRRTERTVVDLL